MSDQETLDRMITIVAWEIVFGGGRADVLAEIIASLISRGAEFMGDA